MNKLSRAKEIIKVSFEYGDCGLFNSRNLVGDTMETVYDEDGLTVDICYDWSYFEVFGLSDEDFEELKKYYAFLQHSQEEEEDE